MIDRPLTRFELLSGLCVVIALGAWLPFLAFTVGVYGFFGGSPQTTREWTMVTVEAALSLPILLALAYPRTGLALFVGMSAALLMLYATTPAGISYWPMPDRPTIALCLGSAVVCLSLNVILRRFHSEVGRDS
ncbi:MAG: hypothetical protein ACR2M1_12770 [Gemmatimonadaceae bacterium]